MQSEFPSSVPEIPVSNISDAIDYYTRDLGFTLDWDGDELGLAGISKVGMRASQPAMSTECERPFSPQAAIAAGMPAFRRKKNFSAYIVCLRVY
jgi:hypothetical protein